MTNIEKYGFKLIRQARISDLDATLYEMAHIKTGASLIYIDRDDENKTFAIGFYTPPTNDTGVFHIIEHSVLCGSEKYPLHDPFAELLKGSLNTFLNAMTYEDRTVYPVSSRCEKDFLNLMDVYLDAVFAPKMLENPFIFAQEGWHYEYDEESGTLSYNGVVYNEMKGAYSSVDDIGGVALNRALFGGTAYGYDSGGNPSSITDLSYEEFKSTYLKHYHPSRAKIILDGKMNIEEALSTIDSHLSRFERRDDPITLAESTANIIPTLEVKYPISDTEDEHGRARILYGYVISDYDDKEAHLTSSILADVLCGSNASPLKKALLDSGLAKDAAIYPIKSKETTIVLEIREADEKKLDEIDRIVKETISRVAEEGIEKGKLNAVLNSIEFRLRERDFGTLPSGIAFSMAMFGVWIYGTDPDITLGTDELSQVKEKLDGNYFEEQLLKMTLNNPRQTKIVMLPDKNLAARVQIEEKEKLSNLLKSMTQEKIEEIIENERLLKEWQDTEESEEAINSLPSLSLSDIPDKINRPHTNESYIDGIKILRCGVKTNEIVYLTLHFDASDMCNEEFVELSTLTSVLMNVPTENHDALSLQNDIKTNLGTFYTSFTVGSRDNTATPYLRLVCSALSSKTEDIKRLAGELLLTSKVDNVDEIRRVLAQIKSQIEDIYTSSGEGFGLARVDASLSQVGAISEYLAGFEAYKIIKEILADEEKLNALAVSVKKLLKKLIDRRRLWISVTGAVSDEFLEGIIKLFPIQSEEIIRKTTAPCADKSEYLLVPSKVAYAVFGGKSSATAENLGYIRVARSILSYEYLWNTIRLKNGAYGAGFIGRREGTIAFYSYRDPSPEKSVEYYKAAAEYLRQIAKRDVDITKFIIGAIGEYDFIVTPKTAATISVRDYLAGYSTEEEIKTRRQMLGMTAKDLLTVADIIDEALENPTLVVVGGEEHLDNLDPKPVSIYKI